MNIYGKTDVGRIRDTNQDTFAYGEPMKGCSFALVCDGMGGQNGGNVASQIARDRLMQQFVHHIREQMSETSVRHLMESAFSLANTSVFEKAKQDPHLSGMGTTAVAAIFLNQKLYIGHVGDSRAYLFANGILTQLTSDHSFVQMLVEKGQLDTEAARNHPRKNEITRAVGVLSQIEMDFTVESFRPGDRLLLCTDGLTGCCSNDQIAQVLGCSDMQQSVDRLIDLANTSGGKDNVTVVVAEQLDGS